MQRSCISRVQNLTYRRPRPSRTAAPHDPNPMAPRRCGAHREVGGRPRGPPPLLPGREPRSLGLAHGLDVPGDLELRPGGGPQVLQRDPLRQLPQHQPLLLHVHHAHVRNDTVYTVLPSEGQRAPGEDLVGALGGVLHGDHHAVAAADQVHGAAHALHHLAGDHPVGQVPVGSHLQRPKHGHVHMASPNHSKRLRAIEVRRPGDGRDGLLAGVDEISIHGLLRGVGPDAQEAVLRVQGDVDAGADEVGGNGGDADTQVHVVAILELQSRPTRDPLPLNHSISLPRDLDALALVHGALLDALLEGRALDDALDVD
mmetsp:Transcript_35012/g.84607  ORF Transcript_35012/g.84607 Transcript_35012/m.84607 type:complete len:314 (-) Transcript_35012:774-1715(-)